MPWTPRENAIDTTPIEQNLLTFIAANQSDALAWANNGTALKDFNFLNESLADPNTPRFPSLFVAGTDEAENSESDVLTTAYQIQFESVVSGAVATGVPVLMRKYANALKSLVKNIPIPELLTDVEDTDAVHFSTAVSYGELQSNEQETAFFQTFQLTVVYRLWASSYS